MRASSQTSKTATAAMNTQDIGCGVSAAHPARSSISTLAYFSRSAFQRRLLLKPFGLDLLELLRHVGLLDEQRLQVVLALLA